MIMKHDNETSFANVPFDGKFKMSNGSNHSLKSLKHIILTLCTRNMYKRKKKTETKKKNGIIVRIP